MQKKTQIPGLDPTVPTPDQAERIEALKTWQEEQGLKDKAFGSYSKLGWHAWYQTKRGAYVGNVGNVLRSFEAARAAYESTQSMGVQAAHFVPTRPYNDLVAYLTTARSRVQTASPERGVVFRAGAGFGKTSILQQLVRDPSHLCVRVPAGVTWKLSFKSALIDLCNALRLPTKQGKRSKNLVDLRDMLKAELSTNHVTLAIEELSGQNVSKRLIELLRELLNETKVVLALFFVDEFAADILDACGETAEQLMQRCRVVDGNRIDLTAVRAILRQYIPQADDTVAALAAQIASQRGGYRLIHNLADTLAVDGITHPTADDVRATARGIHAQWSLRAA